MFSTPFKRAGSGFHVPDDEIDSASDRSREASLQIIDSHPRTYSVPSSDDDLDSNEDDETNEASAVTTPEKSARKRQSSSDCESDSSDGEICESIDCPGECGKNSDTKSDKEETRGTSHSNPIDIEGLSKHKNDVFEIDSEDEGPEVLPISQSYMHAARDVISTSSYNSLKPSHGKSTESSMPAQSHDKTYDEQPAPTHVAEDVIGIEINRTRLQSPKSFLQGSIGDTTDDFDSVDEDDYDNDDDFLMERHDCKQQVPISEPFQSNGLPGFTTPKPRVTFGLAQSTSTEKATSPMVMTYCDAINVSQENTEHRPPISQRAPSPSDAALAKKADTADLRSKWASIVNSPTVNDARKNQETHQPMYSNNWADNYSLNNPIPADSTGQSIFDDPDVESKRYEDGPFASKPSAERYPLFLPHLSQQPWRPCTIPSPAPPQNHFTNGSQSLNVPVTGESKLRFCSTMAEDFNDLPEGLSSIWGDSKVLHQGNEGQSSKVNISDLVNSDSEGARNLKRKADHISTDSEIQAPVSPDTQALLSDNMKSQDVLLPDAQARDIPEIDGSISQGSSIPSEVDQSHSSHVTNTTYATGPARKKLRTFAPSVGGIGKFASGICVGVAGALAAFLATIPLSVREEALREFQSAA